jgi:outer membrane lipoprotein LolB
VNRAACGVVAAVFLLASCATPVQFQQVEFDLAGRIAARYRNEASSGNIAWRHARDGDELLISSPLGQGIARIVRQGDVVTLTTPEREYKASDAESLTEDVLGFRLPLAGLADWVRGRPSADAPAVAENGPDGKLARLQQGGWTIEYLEYAGALPSRLRLAYPGIELRLAISQWK